MFDITGFRLCLNDNCGLVQGYPCWPGLNKAAIGLPILKLTCYSKAYASESLLAAGGGPGGGVGVVERSLSWSTLRSRVTVSTRLR